MTTQTVHIQTFDHGASLTSATLRVVSTDVVVATADSVDEVTADSGLYAAVFGETSVIAAGTYRLRAIVGGQPIQRYVTLTGTDGEVVQSRKEFQGDIIDAPNSTAVEAIQSGLAKTGSDGDTLETLSDQIDGISGAGTGARTITVTVNDGSTALQNAKVRLTEGVNTFVASTNGSGVATLNVDDATYTVAITKAGYTYAGTTLVVDGDETPTYSMTALTITPSSPGFTTGYVTAYDETGTEESGVVVYVELVSTPSSYTGVSLDKKVRTITSDVDGLVEIPGLHIGSTYRIWRGARRDDQYTIPTSAGASYALPPIIGREQ